MAGLPSRPPAPAPAPAEQLLAGRYRIEGELGRGGMGSVYRAHDETTGRVVALKTLDRGEARVTEFFEREYHTLASLKHPRVIEVYEFGIDERGRRFYTMELLGGHDLASIGRLSVADVCAHLRDVATCLSLLHARKLVHRDVSPRNIRLDDQGRAKLIDFGALCAFGEAAELVGTPQCIAPEAIQQGALDQRTDLFALGVVGYWALTGESPYAARTLREVAEAHRTPPAVPSALRPEIPAALDQLLLSMLSINPLERPTSAAEVVERLSAIANLDDVPLEGTVDAHLQSPALVGRAREKQQLSQHMLRAVSGTGGVVVVEGAAGMGVSRLITELALDARILGVTPIRIAAEAHQEREGVLRALIRALLESAPAEAQETLPAYVDVLAEGFPDLQPQFKVHNSPALLPKDPVERRTRIQDAVASWVQAVSQRRALLLTIDDMHLVDTFSAGTLIVLGHAAARARMLLVGTQPVDELTLHPMRQFVRMGARIKLRGLDEAAMEALVASVFGDVPHRTRLAQWLHRVTGGNPGQAFELLKDLVERGVVRYEAGAFTLPESLDEGELPGGLDESFARRIGHLSPLSLRMGRLFAIHRGALGLAEVVPLAPDATRERISEALDQLVSREMLRKTDDVYHFSHELLRTAFLRPLTDDALRALYLCLANGLIAGRTHVFDALARRGAAELATSDLSIALQAASYLIKAGEPTRARVIMREAAIELSVRGDGVVDAVPALEAALQTYRTSGAAPEEVVPMLVPLALAGTYADWRLGYRYADEVLSTLMRLTGLTLAQTLRPVLGARLSLWVGLLIGYVTFVLFAGRKLGQSFRVALLGIIGVGSAAIGGAIVLEDDARARAVSEKLRPLDAFPRHHPARIVRDFQLSMVVYSEGHLHRARTLANDALARMRHPRSLAKIPADARVQLEVGVISLLGPLDTLRTDGSTHKDLEALENVRWSVSRQVGVSIRAAYHGHRGERVRFLAQLEHLDVLAAQAGATWRHDIGVPRTMWSTYVLSEDVMSLKRTMRTLEALAVEAPSLHRLRDVTRACYLAERGLHQEALHKFSHVFETAVAQGSLNGARIGGAFARILRMAGQPQRALTTCEKLLAELGPEDHAFTLASLALYIERARSRAALGQHQVAASELDTLITAHGHHDNPLVRGLLHCTRARVAMAGQNRHDFEIHRAATDTWYERAQNPALAAQYQRLVEEARALGLCANPRKSLAAPAREPRNLPHVEAAFNACRGPAERFQAAIDMVLDVSCAEHGYLYLMDSDGLRFVAPTVGVEPPDGLRIELASKLACIDDLHAATRSTDFRTETLIADDDELARLAAASESHYRSILVTLSRGGRRIAVGAFALVAGDEPMREVPDDFLAEIARGIYGAGDVHTVFIPDLGHDASGLRPHGP